MAKYAKKKNKGKRIALWVVIAVLAVLLAALLLLWWGLYNTEDMFAPTDPTEPSAQVDQVTEPAQEEIPMAQIQVAPQQEEIPLGRGLTLLEVGKYTGIYMEDGSDEVVTDVLMLIVRNDGEQAIQYAELTIPTAAGDAKFSLSTLPVGEKVVLLESGRMAWSAEENYSNVTAENIALFSEELSLREDALQLQTLDGVLNVTNVSGQDITGDIVIYYKNAASDLLYGGITYRVRLEGGLKAEEIRQIMAGHFSESGSRIMFVTVN